MENIENKMESLVFLIPTSLMPPAGFIARVKEHPASCVLHIIPEYHFNDFTLCDTHSLPNNFLFYT